MSAPRTRRLVLVTIVGSLVLLGGALGARRAGALLVVSDPLEPSDAILALDGATPARELEAAALWHRGLAPRVLVSLARDPVDASVRDLSGEPVQQEVSARIYRHRGLPPQAIVRLTPVVDNTEQELQAAWEYGRRAGFRRIILVTSPTHTRRVRLIWNTRYQTRMAALVHPDSYERFDSRWWRTRRSLQTTLHEWLGIAHFLGGSPLPTFDHAVGKARPGVPTSWETPPATAGRPSPGNTR